IAGLHLIVVPDDLAGLAVQGDGVSVEADENQFINVHGDSPGRLSRYFFARRIACKENPPQFFARPGECTSVGCGPIYRPTGESVIEVSDLKKSYGSLQAVAGVSFAVAQGETFGLLGPNGAGKTTTIHMLTGALTPDAGTIQINGQADPTRVEVRQSIGLAPQPLALYDTLTADETLSFFGRLYGLGGAKLHERVDGALKLAGLQDRRGDRVGTYSGGMKRRLNLACALVHDPPVVFLDEPTVG